MPPAMQKLIEYTGQYFFAGLRTKDHETADLFAVESLTAGSYQASFARPKKRNTKRLLTSNHSILGFIFPMCCYPL